jgi:hypothetical protein
MSIKHCGVAMPARWHVEAAEAEAFCFGSGHDYIIDMS